MKNDIKELIRAVEELLDRLPNEGLLLAGGSNTVGARKSIERVRAAISDIKGWPIN